ncbi:ATP-binding cassette domain-containing protein [candidate division KSB1 bacterium]|nr:ATP-binding cassette domain-containing protein [candidate division KSB1 bacterium]MBL7095821.1 ATP-binding cassette domain-containing protein [candidate division KSB1 bacterium]
MINISNISYSYDTNQKKPIKALDEINLQFREGEFIALMGHNSSGKTTLARTLNGLIQPQSGEVSIDELSTTNPQDIIPIRRKVGMVFQNPDNQIITTSVEREVAFGLENLGVKTEMMHQVVTAILERFNLTKYRKHPPHLLSGGEKQRLALASVLAMNPKYLVLDEPTSMLDPQGRHDLLNLLAEIKADNAEKKTTDQITIIFITQFPEEALYADRLIVMEKGKVVFDETPEIVFQNIAQLKKIGLEAPVEYEILPLLVEKGFGVEVLDKFR